VTKASVRRFVLAVWAFVCAAILTTSLWPAAELIRTEDQNHDGRPDIWRFYDRHGQLTRVEIDTNFDGRSDHRDYYRDGTLTRSESDRNFDNRIDLVEDFDRSGRQHLRSVVDANFDGAADLLVLFQDGRPIYSEWTTTPRARNAGFTAASFGGADARYGLARPDRDATGPLTPLDDPFSASASLRAGHRARAPDIVGMSPASLMLEVPVARLTPIRIAPRPIAPAIARHPRSLTLLSLPARGPPASAHLG
jgi:hypothetical protein